MNKSTTLLDQDFVLTAIALPICSLYAFEKSHPDDDLHDVCALQIDAIAWVAEYLGLFDQLTLKAMEVYKIYVEQTHTTDRKLEKDLITLIKNFEEYRGKRHGQNGHD